MKLGMPLVLCAWLVAAAAAAMTPSAAWAAAEAYAAPSCGEWVAQRKKANTLSLSNASWLRGYLAGLAAGSRRDFLAAAADNASIYAWMDSYCRSNPLKDTASGAQAYRDEALAAARKAPGK